MQKSSLLKLMLAGLLLYGATAFAERPAGEKERNQQALSKPTGTPRYQILNINNIWTWIRNDGMSNHSPIADDGTYFPRGTGSAIYQDGIMWGGKVYLDPNYTQPGPKDQLIRVGGANYLVGTREGRIIGEGASAVAANTADADVRAYRIRRDYAVMSDTEKRRDAAEYNEIPVANVTDAQVATIMSRYALDWKEWPVQQGAPYIERNGTPGYQPPPEFSATFTVDDLIKGNYDEPGIAGADPNSPADQVVWTVFNDLDASTTLQLQGSEPLGLEIQVTLWGYKRTDALGNIYFRRVKLINKGGVDVTDAGGTKGSFYINEMYVAQWSDPDLGNSGDDVAGCDVNLSLGYVYNGQAVDSEYRGFRLPPPAIGYDFLQGPAVPGDPTDRAVFDLKYKDGFKNLGMTSFSYFSAGSPISDPPRSYTQGTIRWYKMLRGFAPIDGDDQYYPFPPGVAPDQFPLSGDPVTKTGFLDGEGEQYSFVPGDRRINLSTGPFSLNPGETQEVVVAVVGGLGADRISSVAVMKFNDRFAQNTYNALFQVPKPPVAPIVTVSELDGTVGVEWGSNLNRVRDTETTVQQPGGYAFEGYNVYQFPSRGASLSEAKRIAVFDLATDPTVVLDEQFDLASGQILNKPVQFGTNSGIARYFNFNRDYVRDIGKLYNGQEYYLAVTAYSRATVPGYLPASLESEPTIITVVPRVPFGIEYETAFGDTLKVNRLGGGSDGIVLPIVVNPKASTGDSYEVRFAVDNDGNTTWNLLNTTKGTTVLTNKTNQSGDEKYDIIDGIFLVVSGPPPGVKEWEWTAGSRFLTWADAAGLEFEGFEGALGWASPRSVFGDGTHIIPADKLKKIEIRFANADANDLEFDPNQPNVSYAYRHGRGFGGAPARPEFAPYIINTGGSYSYQDFTKSVPLAVYDVDANPPRRLAVAFLENNAVDGKVDGRYNPGVTGTTNNTASTGPREWLWIFDADYSETPNPAWQVEIIEGPQPVMYFATWQRRNANAWTDGNVITITPNRPNTPDDAFSFAAPAPKKGGALDAASAQNIGVYPNPYYAFNPAENTTLNRFVTFNNLPPNATVRIFNMAGQLVRKLEKVNDSSQFLRWDLQNQTGLPVASGMYIAHVEATLPATGAKAVKVLKLAVIQEQEVLEVF
ncbi:T9SS type A sorting domain-containing protein [candidate division KSB1 bacterium]|nr:T9SS type A sorting domain-containing protein [bacterium]NUM64278.1 T9SS type A sorting domain-containing protein [candidate division KSB1 bacterium]